MLTHTDPHQEVLADGLVLRCVANQADIERLAEFNRQIHGPGVADMTRELILRHPHTRPEHWLYVEDPQRHTVVSSLCLIPWALHYEGVPLRAGEMGIVGTHEAYRRRGLVRTQVARYARMLERGQYHLSHIQGIPYFYRQFGYEYAMPLEGGWRLELDTLPAPADPPHRYTFRAARETEIPDLVRFYDGAATSLGIGTVRGADVWRYLLGPSMATEMVAQTWLVLDAGETVGYLRIPEHGFGEGLIVNEVSSLTASAARAVLRQLVSWARERRRPYVRLCVPAQTAIVAEARSLGAHSIGHYAWQVRIVDVPRFLRQIAPVLERRIASSPFSGLSRALLVNVYRDAYQLDFEQGRLVGVQQVGMRESGDLRLPPPLLAPLLLGYRCREELARHYHDVSTTGESQHLIDVLFPQMSSFLYTVY